MKLNPGDKVRITLHAFEPIDVVDIIVATRHSIGTVLSYKEYYDYYVNKHHLNEPFSNDHYLSLVRDWINNCEHYPIRFDTVEPLSGHWAKIESQGRLYVDCKIGKIEVLSVRFLEKISESY